MLKKYFLITILAIHSAQAMQRPPLLKNLAKMAYMVGFNLYAINTLLLDTIYDKFIIKGLDLLNEDKDHKDTVKEILDIYAPNNKEIKIYGPTAKKGAIRRVDKNAIQAFALKDQKIIVYAALEEALKEPENELRPLTKGILGHEIGHVINNDIQRIYVTLASNSALTCCAAYKFLNLPVLNKTRFAPLKIAPLMGVKFIADLYADCAYRRKIEREADSYAIQHTKDPLVLKAFASCLKDLAHKYEKSDISISQKLLSTHPSFTERATYFEKATRSLEEKLK